jgi:predicted transcriptional regulator
MKNRDHMDEMMVRLFGSTSRPRILSLFLSRPRQTFYQREIMHETRLSLQAVQRELKNLIRLRILKKRETKSRVYYQVNSASPWFRPLKEICELLGRG